MPELIRSPSKSAAGAIAYVTVGTLLMVWSVLWYAYFLYNRPDAPVWQRFTCTGMIISGLAVVAIGLLFGLIGREAKVADTTVAVVAPEATVPVVESPASVPLPDGRGAVAAPAARGLASVASSSVPANGKWQS